MRTLTFIAIAMMCMWISGEANAQQDTQASGTKVQRQVDGQKPGKGQRGQGRRGNRRQGNQQGNQQRGRQGRAGGPQFIEMLFNRFDADKSGSISLAEAPERMKPRFANIDANGDKSVSKEELEAAFAKVGQARQGRGQAGNNKNGRGKNGKGKNGANKKAKGNNGQGQRRGQNLDAAVLIKRLDKNNDGVLSIDEAPERMKDRFDRVDADSDGSVTVDELKAVYEKLKKGGNGGQFGRDKSAGPDATKPVKPKRPPMVKDGA